MAYYYAIEHAYGRAVNQGNRANMVHRFTSVEERDNWTKAGPDYTTEPGFREALRASDRRVKRAKATCRSFEGWQKWPVPQTD